MGTDIPSLALTAFPSQDRLFLVRITDAIRLCREGGHEQLPLHQAPQSLLALQQASRTSIRQFVQKTRIIGSLADCDDSMLFERLRDLVRTGVLVPVRVTEQNSGNEAPDLVKQRRVVRAMASGGKALRLDGRSFRLMAGADLRKMRDRDDYDVVPQAEAQRVLDGIAKTAPAAQAAPLVEARKLLARDWRPPLQPDGLVLLKKVVARQGPAQIPEPLLPGRQAAASEPVAEEPAVEEEDGPRPCAATLAQAAKDGAAFCEACSAHA